MKRSHSNPNTDSRVYFFEKDLNFSDLNFLIFRFFFFSIYYLTYSYSNEIISSELSIHQHIFFESQNK